MKIKKIIIENYRGIKEKQEMARKIKKLEKQIEELHLRLIKK